MSLSSKVHEMQDVWEWVETAYEKNWTDGLPVLPPTPARVEALVAATGLSADHVLGKVPPAWRLATVEKVAINAAMAGCKPEYMPLILTALDALLDEEFNLGGVETTTHSCEPLTIVSGPIVKELGFNYGDGVFGGGSRANATIGRAIRLILWNIGGSFPGNDIAKAPMSHPGRYTFCIAENIDANPWKPMHTDFGVSSENGVTVFACDAPQLILGLDKPRAATVVARAISRIGTNHPTDMRSLGDAQILIILSGGSARKLASEGWTKDEFKRAVFDKARNRIGDLQKLYDFDPQRGNFYWPKWVDQMNPETMVPIVTRPENLIIAVAGGVSAPWFSAYCPGWGSHGGFAVSRPLDR